VPDSPATDHLYTSYVAPWTGGIFRSTNNGTTFESIFEVTVEVGGATFTQTAEITGTQGWSVGLQPRMIR
jgi:hypothetical protein